MKTSVIITNYNYGKYVGDAVESSLNQSQLPDEIIVIDDGSKDNSRDLLTQSYKDHERVTLIFKKNQGHMSCFNEGIKHSTGDIIFFLDADDTYLPNHIESVTEHFAKHRDIDFISTGYEYTGDKQGSVLQSEKNRCLGYSTIAVYFGSHWVGGQTSVISIRRSLANKVFPYPDEWLQYTCGHGEVGLVMGSSILGAKKYYIAEVQVQYRAHDNNHDLDQQHNHEFNYKIETLCFIIMQYYWNKLGISPLFILKALPEFKTIESPSYRELINYRRLIMKTPQPFMKRLEQTVSAYKHYLNNR